MNPKIRAVIVAALAAVSIFAFTSNASAGTYQINPHPCEGLYVNADGWLPANVCRDGFLRFQLNPTPDYPVSAPGSYFFAKVGRLPDPDVLSLQEVRAHMISNGLVNTSSTHTTPRITFGACLNLSGVADHGWQAAGDFGCAVNFNPYENEATNWSHNYVCGGTSLRSCYGGWGLQIRARSGATGGFLNVDQLYATVNDSSAPSVTASAGNALNSGQWVRGSVPLSAAASDTGGGVAKVALHTTSQIPQLLSTTYGCNFATWAAPCPTSYNWNSNFDTTTLADGTRTAFYSATAASNDVATSGNFSLKIDNTEPETPTEIAPDVSGMDGWSSTNDFDVNWTNGAEVAETTTMSGLDKVVVDVNPTTGSQTNPAPVTVPIGGSASGISATSSSVSGLTVPAVGQWSVRLQLIDRAGNVSDVGDGSGGSADSDVSIGYDPNTPAKADGYNNGWVSRGELEGGTARQSWQDPQPLAGRSPVCGWALSVSGNQFDVGGTQINVNAPTTEWTFPKSLTEGIHWSHIRAISCALQPSDVTDHQEVKVDLTDPVASVDGVTEGRWYKDGKQVTLRGADALSGMVGANPGSSDDSRDGAYIAYTLNGAGPADKDAPRGGEAIISANGEGQKLLKFAPVDVAGNKAGETEVRFGIDASNPEGFFESQDPERPTLLRAPLSDAVSGVDHAVVQIREGTSGPWTSLTTSLAGFSGGQVDGVSKSAVAQARFPDTKLPEGTYQVRVAAYDQAGNELLTSKDKNGNTYTVTNPMRQGTGLSASVYRGLHKCKRMKKSKCVKKQKGRVFLSGGKSHLTVGYKRAGIVQGYLTKSNYAPLAKQPLEIYTQVQGQPEKLEGEAATKADGSYYFRLKPGVSRKVRVVFAGTELLQGSDSRVSFATAAKVSLRVSKKRVATGQKVVFTGKVISVDKVFPASGKIIALQYLSGGKWRPAVAITRTKPNGAFKVTYRFDRIPRGVKAKIKFRVFAPTELGFSHANSASRTKVVKVNF